MKTKININGKEVEITLTKEQVDAIKKCEKVTDRIKTYEDACRELNTCPIQFSYDDTKDEIAYKKLKSIVKALNEGWEPNWSDSNEYKYYPWFEMSKKPGCSFYLSDYCDWSTFSCISASLCFKNKELSEYAGKQFEKIYYDYMTI